MRAIVTGATGFVGKELVQELTDNGIDVVAIVRNNKKIPEAWKNMAKIQLLYGDLHKLEKIDISGIKDVEFFYHLGWFGTSGMERADIDGQLENVKSACEAVRLCEKCGCKTFVNAGSIMEYEVVKLMTSGNYVPGMSNIYSTAKLTADFMARTLANALHLKYINVIISNIYGAGEKSARFLNTTLRKMLKNEPVPLTHGNQIYDFIYITDAVKMICAAGINGNSNESYYIGNSVQKPLKTFIEEMKESVRSESDLHFGAVPLTAPTLGYNEFDTAKVERELRISPSIDFREGILKLKEYIMGENDE